MEACADSALASACSADYSPFQRAGGSENIAAGIEPLFLKQSHAGHCTDVGHFSFRWQIAKYYTAMGTKAERNTAAIFAERLGYPVDRLTTIAGSPPSLRGSVAHVTSPNRAAFLAIAVTDRHTTSSLAALKVHVAQSPSIGLIALLTRNRPNLYLRRNFPTNTFTILDSIEPYSRRQLRGRIDCISPTAPETGHTMAFSDCHRIIRDTDSLHPDEALDELCKLLALKTYDEAISPSGPALNTRNFGSQEEYCASARMMLMSARALETIRRGHRHAPSDPSSQSIALSSPCLARVLQRLEGISLNGLTADNLGEAFQAVLDSTSRQGMGQYFTPPAIVDAIVSIIQPTISERVLDPFCGSGRFLVRSLDFMRTSNPASALSEVRLHGIEKSDRIARIARTNCSFQSEGRPDITHGDFLAIRETSDVPWPGSFDVIMTNPPFGCKVSVKRTSALSAYELAAGKTSVPLEILGLEKAVTMLRPGGRLAIILPDGILSGTRHAKVRNWIHRHLVVRILWSLPPETFAPYGAAINTSIIFASKKPPTPIAGNRKVLAISQDTTPGVEPSEELTTCIKACHDFIAKEGW